MSRTITRPFIWVYSAVLAVAITQTLCTVTAQVPFELEWRASEQYLVTVDSPEELAALSKYERATILSGAVQNYTGTRGYSPEDGLYDVRAYDVPKRSDLGWWRRPIARLEQTSTSIRAYDPEGEVISEHAFDQTNRSVGYRLANHAAENSLGHPFPQRIVPNAAEQARLVAEGYALTDGLEVVRRSTTRLSVGDLAQLLLGGEDSSTGGEVIIARASDHVIVYDGQANTRSYTHYGPQGEAISHSVRRFATVTLADGSTAYLATDEISMAPDTLLHGTVVTRSTLTRRWDHTYQWGGRDGFSPDPIGIKIEGLSVFPNPLRGTQLFVELPAAAPTSIFSLRVTGSDGKVVADRLLSGDPGTLAPVALGNALTSGAYGVRLCQNGDCWTQLVVVP